jgi:hypothetical protein
MIWQIQVIFVNERFYPDRLRHGAEASYGYRNRAPFICQSADSPE